MQVGPALIDRSAGRNSKEPGKNEGTQVNTALAVSPEAVLSARGALEAYLEWESHKRAVANGPLWSALYRSGVLPADAKPGVMRETALIWYGFVPVSPDGADFHYDSRTGEVLNARHGSFDRLRLHSRPDSKAPLVRLLEGLSVLRADLRFREDGVHTTLILEPREKK